MKYVGYVFIGIILFFSLEILTVNIGNALGSGAYEIGLITTAISFQSSIIVLCTLLIVDTINKVHKN